MGKRMGKMGNTGPVDRPQNDEDPAEAGPSSERTTRFELATLTLAKGDKRQRCDQGKRESALFRWTI